MKLIDYLKDKRYLILFYTIHMTFIYAVVFFDRSNQMLSSNLIYMSFVATTMFVLYLGVGFLRRKMYYTSLIKLREGENNDWIVNLPKAQSIEDKIYQNLIIKQDEMWRKENVLYSEKAKEDLDFITVWVHEIKTPIAVTRLLIENNLKSEKEQSWEKSLYSIEEEIDKIEDHVQKALYYIRLNDFSKDYYIASIDIEKMVKESIKRHSKSFISKRISIELESLNGELSTDKKWMAFILDQIIGNSIKYTSSGGSVRIYKEAAEKEILLHIKDNGIGIKVEDINRIFNKSFTGSNGREQFSSTGMGLYLSQKMAKKLGHFISVESKVREGTIFTIHFPKWTDYFDITKV